MNKPLPRSEYERHLKNLGAECAFCTMSDALNIKEYKYWILVYAAFPYRKYHTLLVSKRHVTNFSELENGELSEFAYITEDVNRIYKESGIVGDGSVYGDQLFFSWRSRDKSEISKKSVSHLHLHFYPEIGKDINIVLDENAWDIDTSLLTNKE